jgi:2-polyprenyl-6-methoxyphenol hydroxylase-like FAD-dependent oxidoreductase
MKVLVSGAGIAGPTLAHWLLHGGHEPTLVEHAPAFRTGGYVIDFWGVGYRVAERMGIERAVLDAGYRVHALRSVDDAGRIRSTLDTDVFQRVAGGKFTSLPRGDLAALVYATIDGRVEALFGNSIAEIEEHDAGVRVAFEHGAERGFDLVVGADGLHSNVRRLVFGPEADYERFLGCRVAACVVEGYRPRDELVYVTHNVPNRQVGRFALRGDRTMFLFVFRSDATDIPDDIAARKAVLRREFADAGWECPAILDAMESADELYFDVVSQILMPGWSRGRIALLGDAAACVSLLAGEGTGLAMTGAYVLAGELHRADGDWRRAFAAYEAKMRPFVRGKQDAARKYLAFFATRTRFGIWLRDMGMRIANHPSLADMFVGRGLRDDFDLPEYGL